jgi:hypothetical protein
MLAARELGVSYGRTLMIGRQNLLADGAAIVKAHEDAGQSIDPARAAALARGGDGFAEPILRHLGAVEIDSLDASTYEGSSIIHDMNDPLPERLKGKYSLVFDGGSIEHVFNLPQALKNCMQAVELGGHFITVTPVDSLVGHGFYQFSPELFYRALAPQNGFEVVTLLVRASHHWAHWRAVSDSASVGGRVTMTSPWETLMFVLAKRVDMVEPFSVWPQQSDYVTVWEGGPRIDFAGPALLARLPFPMRRAARLAMAVAGTTSAAEHFQRVRMIDIARGQLP